MSVCCRFAIALLLLTTSLSQAEERVTGFSPDAESLFSWRESPWESPAVERDRLVTDRPHLCEATSLVGLGRVQLETGYSFFNDDDGGNRSQTHSFPEPLLRWGIFAEWFELRLGYNYLSQAEKPAVGPTARVSGSDDFLVAAKVALFKQHGWLPDFTVFPQLKVPTGSPGITAGEPLPGVNLAYSWAVTEVIEIECNTVLNRRRDDASDFYLEVFQAVNFEYDLGDRWLLFTEYAAFVPSGSDIAPFQHYFHYGAQYFITPNVQVDVHSAVGLNRAADNLAFTGIGLSFRR